MTIYTIGFTKKTAADFFYALRTARVSKVLDTRLNNQSQLAGFTKKSDLPFFLKEIAGIEYFHLPELAPTKEMLKAYRATGDWEQYEKAFLDLLGHRRIEKTLDPELFSNACLLCSEDKPHHCHRRLVAEYLKDHWKQLDIQIIHL